MIEGELSIDHHEDIKMDRFGWFVGAMVVALILGFVSGRISMQNALTSENQAGTRDHKIAASTRTARKSGSISSKRGNGDDKGGGNGRVGSSQDAQRKMKMLLNRMEQNPKAAITWGLEQAKDEKSEVEIVESYLDNWARQDPKAAGAWYDQQEGHLKTSKTVKSSVRNLNNRGDYKQAFAWAAREGDPVKANELKRDIYQAWVKDSPNKAESWINGEGHDVMEGVDLTEKEDQ